jgi:hypothetical protein
MSERKDRSRLPSEGDSPEPFLRRWARRKEEARTSRPAEPAPVPPAAAAEARTENELRGGQSAPAPQEQEDEGAEASPELPTLESLNEDSDYSAFMRAGVSPDLRREALRKLFRGEKYGLVDPLDPFRADFGKYAPLGDIVTADMKYHAERLLRAELERVAADAESDERTAEPAAQARVGDSAAPGTPRLEDPESSQDETPEENDGRRDT